MTKKQIFKKSRVVTIDGKKLRPESLMMSYGYHPEWSEGALKCPIFQTSTFVFESAEKGKAFFEIAYGLRDDVSQEQLGLIYSRLNNPDLEILEDRLTLWDEAEDCAVFESGMGAISSCFTTFLKPGDLVLFSEPVYGGTDYFLNNILTKFGIDVLGFQAQTDPAEVEQMLKRSGKADRLAMVYIETPANPTNDLVDIGAFSDLAKNYSTSEKRVLVAIDNTFLGPLWQHPLKHGADLVLYSATKFIGGHSDVIAGACLGSAEMIKDVKATRTFFGAMAGPWSGWLLLRSLETLKMRMTQQMENAKIVADFLTTHPKIEKVYYPNLLKEGSKQYEVYKKQCLSPGSMISFDIKGGEKEAFRFLNGLSMIKLAVSLGGTESLAEHPATMTHSDIEPAMQKAMGITEKMVRLSVGVENVDDIIACINHALENA
ncbi:MAG: cystathionine gamma-synthase family protein [Ignavibacteria bacterium]|nr:cystathionine gamma-synthase family protein [Ignavibacteria bacterium]